MGGGGPPSSGMERMINTEEEALLRLTNRGDRDEQKETSNTDSMTQGQTMRVHAAAFFVNFVLWIFMVSVVFLRKDSMRHFTYPMTKRFGINTNYTRIDEVFNGWNGSRLGQVICHLSICQFVNC